MELDRNKHDSESRHALNWKHRLHASSKGKADLLNTTLLIRVAYKICCAVFCNSITRLSVKTTLTSCFNKLVCLMWIGRSYQIYIFSLKKFLPDLFCLAQNSGIFYAPTGTKYIRKRYSSNLVHTAAMRT